MVKHQEMTTTTGLALTALFTALTVICTWVTVPLPFTPIPVNLALFAVYAAGGLLGPRYGVYSQLLYMLLGAVGLPVFAGFSGGLARIAGPTGGYIVGYVFAALLVGLLLARKDNLLMTILACVCGMIACYAFGTAWYVLQSGCTLWAALIACVFPFLIGDAVKIVAAVILIRRLRPMLKKESLYGR